MRDNSFDVVVTGQVLHLIDDPDKAAAEMRRVANSIVVLPISSTKHIHGTAKLGVGIYRLFGFASMIELDAEDYKWFLPTIGFKDCEHIQIDGKIPMAVAVWRKASNGGTENG